MSISMRPSFHGGKDNLNQIFSLYYNPDSDFFYQKTEISFFILLLNVHSGFQEESTFRAAAVIDPLFITSDGAATDLHRGGVAVG